MYVCIDHVLTVCVGGVCMKRERTNVRRIIKLRGTYSCLSSISAYSHHTLARSSTTRKPTLVAFSKITRAWKKYTPHHHIHDILFDLNWETHKACYKEYFSYLWYLVIVFIKFSKGYPQSVRFTNSLLYINSLHSLCESIDHLTHTHT